MEDDELVRLSKRERFEQDTVDECDHDGGRANPKRRNQHRDDGKPWLVTEGAKCVPRVLEQLFGPAGATCFPAVLLHLLRTAKCNPGFALGLCSRVAARDQVSRMLVQMESQLLFKLLFLTVPAPQTRPPVHWAPRSAVPRMRPTPSINRCQLAASVSSCLRPFRVSL